MPRLKRKIGPLGLALTVWDVYRRLPPAQRKQLLQLARKYGPAVATKVMLLRKSGAKKR